MSIRDPGGSSTGGVVTGAAFMATEHVGLKLPVVSLDSHLVYTRF